MALIDGRQLGKVLIQNIWKILCAFVIGVIAVVSGGLIVSDVHRIPQGIRSSAKSVSQWQGQKSQPVQAPVDSTNGAPFPIREAQRDEPAQDDPAGPVRRRPSSKTRSKVSDEGIRPSTTPSPIAVSPAGETPGIIWPSTGRAATQIISALPSSPDSVLTLRAETPITIRLAQQVSSKENHKGEMFKGTLAAPLKASGVIVAEAGALVLGRIVDARNARLFRGGSNLNLELTQVDVSDGRHLSVKTTQWYETGSYSKFAKAASFPGKAAQKAASGVMAGVKDEQNEAPNSSERTVTEEPADSSDKGEKKKSAVTLPPGSEIVFRLLEPVTLSGTRENR